MATLLVLHGPNLNRLGRREPAIYGSQTLAEIDARLRDTAVAAGHALRSLQSNSEAVLIDSLHSAADASVDFIIINPAAFTHTSIALRDALAAADCPFIEVHLSNVHARETFRRQSYFSDLALGVITGLGAAGYDYALQHALAVLSESTST